MKINSTLLVTLILVIAGAAFWYFSTQTGNDIPLTTGIEENLAQTQFTMLVSKLQPITFNTSIFSEPNFLALVDLTTPITPETSGRPDPFAPIPGVIVK